jgi:uracil-DNA glycosylase
LNNLKIIITLGSVALDAIKVISTFSNKDKFSSLPGNFFDINIDNKPLKLYPMFHTGNLGYVNASKANQNPNDLWKNTELTF